MRVKPRRGVWELTTPRLGDLLAMLQAAGETPCTELRLQEAGFDEPAVSMLVGMPAHHAATLVGAVLAERTVRPRPQLELVWSGPEPAEAQARDTGQVLRELFAAAERRVIVAGFAFWSASGIFEALHRRALARQLAIDFFIHVDPTGASPQMTPAAFFRHSWPWADVPIAVYYDTRIDGDGEQGSMHAKCVVIDEAAAFITSANFTAAAQQRNVEVGVLVRDVDFATRVAAQWRTLAAHGIFRPLASR